MLAPRFVDRIVKAQAMMREDRLDVLLIGNRENLIYFSGATQIECMVILIPREGEACAIVLSQDEGYLSKTSGLETLGYIFPRDTLARKIADRIQSYGYRNPRIGVERYLMGHATHEGLRTAFTSAVFVGAGDLFYRLRSVKDPGEIGLLRTASNVVSRGMAAAAAALRPGVTELDVLAEAEYAMLKAGSWGSPFRPQIVSGERSILTHPCATDKEIAPGEIVVLHLGASVEGYCSKICRTAAIGTIPPGQEEVHGVLLAAQREAIAAVRSGTTSHRVDAAARRVVEDAGFGSDFLDVIGYGIGLRQSEFHPIIGKNRTEIIEEGMVIDLLLPTIYRPGCGGPRVTDVIAVGKRGHEVLTDFPRELMYR